jgi:uracil-DNA glycosylase
MWFEQMHPGWQVALEPQREWLASMEAALKNVPDLAPSFDHVMAAFTQDPARIRVVVVGQDPYPTPGMPVGRAFAVSNDTAKLPASLKNIVAELTADLAENPVANSSVSEGAVSQAPNWFAETTPAVDLSGWQEQGVFLLNRHLTTLQGAPEAHAKLGWADFTLAAVRALVARSEKPFVLLLWGSHAQKLLVELGSIDDSRVRAVTGVHPSPLSAYRGFFGSRPFSAVNRQLVELGQAPIDWSK